MATFNIFVPSSNYRSQTENIVQVCSSLFDSTLNSAIHFVSPAVNYESFCLQTFHSSNLSHLLLLQKRQWLSLRARWKPTLPRPFPADLSPALDTSPWLSCVFPDDTQVHHSLFPGQMHKFLISGDYFSCFFFPKIPTC